MKKILLFVALCVGVFAKPLVTVSILPQKYFLEQIAGDTLAINVMVKKGDSPATYEPKAKQMGELEKSKLYFAIGVPYERVWLEKFHSMYPKLDIIRTDAGIDKIQMAAHHHPGEEHEEHECDCHKAHKHEAHEHEEHEHKHAKHEEHEHDHAKHDCDCHKHEKKEAKHEEHDCDCHKHETHKHEAHEHEHKHEAHEHKHGHHHHHGMKDPHIWVDPLLVKVQAKNMYNALSKAFPENKALYAKNLKSFEEKLDKVHEQLKIILKDVKGKTFLVYHPAWGYFAKRYSLNQEAIEIEGKEPKAKQLAQIIDEAKEDKVKVIFVAPQFSQKAASTIAKAIDGAVISIDQLSEDWADELIKSAKILAKHLK